MLSRSGWFALSDGRRLFALEWAPEAVPKGVVLCLHGAESHAGWFDELAPGLVREGLATHAFDRPGWGRSPGPHGRLTGAGDALDQVSQVAMALRRRFPSLHLLGLSWGGLLALYAALRRGDLFDSLALVVPGIYLRKALAPPGLARIAAALACGRDWRAPLVLEPADFTSRPDRLEYIRNDPHRTDAVGPGFCMATLRMRRFVAKALPAQPLHAASAYLAERDSIIDNEPTRRLLTRRDVQVHVYADAAHCLVFERPARLAADVARACEAARGVARP